MSDEQHKRPSFDAFSVNEGKDEKSYFTKIGAAFEHKDGATAAVILAMVVVFFAFWTGARVKAAAENEASLLRERYAAEIASAREEGETALADLQADLARQSDVAAEQLTEIGADLASLSEERDVVRQELEQFITLRERVGIELVDFRGRTVVVVPEGARLRRWRAAGLSEVAHLNGRMYRLSD